MRALTIKQPWAGAIFERGKNVENRSWPTNYRGPLAIHAGAAPDRSERAVLVRDGAGDVWTPSAIVGTVELVDCIRTARSRWAMDDSWHWILRDPRPLSAAIPAKGRLGLWRVDDAMLRQMHRRLR